ncbi:hypothetical protein ACIQ9E_23295 [Streptomyces sp. NPDC094448]|uniref:hypothetical protein n=1 Tax=Streptomyces sp. NPDC094448 TaxID=3366063 RepID=UPI00382C879D
MTLKTLQVDAVWVRRLAALTEHPWDRPGLEETMLRYGWARPGQDGRPAVGWGGGAAEPHRADDSAAEEDGGIGWRLELGDAPGEGAVETFVRLPCALYWPAFGDEPDEAEGGADDDEDDDEDDLDDDYGPAWIRQPGATRADLHAEYERLGRLIRTELGAPDESGSGELDERREEWNRRAGRIVLELTDDINSYSHYDVVALRIELFPGQG